MPHHQVVDADDTSTNVHSVEPLHPVKRETFLPAEVLCCLFRKPLHKVGEENIMRKS